MITEENVHNALKTIIKNQESKALNYCVNYAKAGLCLRGETLRVQCLYVLNNMVSWRGEEAKGVRLVLKEFVKTRRQNSE